ncbi:hypothetical protein JYT44_01010 [Caldithrix abyssi]|nr:hypothetical protein [Caldithrix abyssi]
MHNFNTRQIKKSDKRVNIGQQKKPAGIIVEPLGTMQYLKINHKYYPDRQPGNIFLLGYGEVDCGKPTDLRLDHDEIGMNIKLLVFPRSAMVVLILDIRLNGSPT